MTDVQMGFQTTAGVFATAVKAASLAVDRKSPMPILLMLRLEAMASGAVKVNGTNLSLAAGSRFNAAAVSAPGATAVDQQRLLEILTRFTADKKCGVKLVDNKFVLTCGSSRYELATLPAADFPTLPKPSSKAVLELPAELLSEVLGTVEYAMLDDDHRAHLSGVALWWGENKLWSAATDGLSMAMLGREHVAEVEGSVFVPHRAVGVLRKFCDAIRGATVSLAVQEAELHAWGASDGVSCKLVDAKLPDYARIAPKGASLTSGFVADRLKLVEALERLLVAIPKDAESRAARFYCDKEVGRVEVTSVADQCSGKEVAKAEVHGDGEVSVDAARVVAALKAFGAEKARLAWGPNLPVTIDAHDKGRAFLGLVMPLTGG